MSIDLTFIAQDLWIIVNLMPSHVISPQALGNQADRLLAEQSRQHHMEAPTIFDAAGEASPGDGGKLSRGSRKTIALATAINHRHEAGAEYRAWYLLASIALRTAAIWRVRIPVKCHL